MKLDTLGLIALTVPLLLIALVVWIVIDSRDFGKQDEYGRMSTKGWTKYYGLIVEAHNKLADRVERMENLK